MIPVYTPGGKEAVEMVKIASSYFIDSKAAASCTISLAKKSPIGSNPDSRARPQAAGSRVCEFLLGDGLFAGRYITTIFLTPMDQKRGTGGYLVFLV